MNRLSKISISIMISVIMLLCFLPAITVKAESASTVSIGTIDYDKLTMQVFRNGNTIIYYSTDGNTWTEVEGAYDSASDSYNMDISWVSVSSETLLYFKGDVNKTINAVTLPSQNTSFSVDYDKAEGIFSINSSDDVDTFQWRKASDYHWTTVDLEEDSSSYKEFMNEMEAFRITGTKIIIRTPQVMGNEDNVGIRPSKEVTITIIGRAAAPAIKINLTKMTLNTTTAMEFYEPVSGLWVECTSSMSFDEIAPSVLYENGGTAAIVMIRKAATTKAPYSKTAYVSIPGQTAAPVIGGDSADASYYINNSRLILKFNKASANNMYEYTIVRPEYSFDAFSASWRTVNSTSPITFSTNSAPAGSKIYIRRKGKEANSGLGTSLILPSAAVSFTVDYN